MKRPIVAVPALFAATALALIAPPSANAGVYRAAVCNPALGAPHPDAVFARTSHHYVSNASCGDGQAGLAVRHEGKRTGQGRWGGWTVRAPRGTVISHLGVSAAGRRAGGQVPQLLTAPLAGPLQPFRVPDPGMERSRWNGRARSFVARLACARDGGCGEGERSGIRIKRLSLRMADRVRPRIALRGLAFAAGKQARHPGDAGHRHRRRRGHPSLPAPGERRARGGPCRRVPSRRAGSPFASGRAPFRPAPPSRPRPPGRPSARGRTRCGSARSTTGLDTQANRACAERQSGSTTSARSRAPAPDRVLEAHISRSPLRP